MTESKTLSTGTISRMFIAFRKRYGTAWESQFESQDHYRLELNRWHDHLKKLTYDDLRRGYENWKHPEPPTLEQFIDACQGKKRKSNARPQPELWKSIPERDKASKDSVQNYLKQMRGDLI